MDATREGAIARAEKYFDDGTFLADLARRVAIPTTSQEPAGKPALVEYVAAEMSATLLPLGYDCAVLPNPVDSHGPFLIARRIEDPTRPTVLTYGHGDVIRGQEAQWRHGLSPWRVVVEGDRIYGRGTADNKGQHSINIASLAAVIAERGSLGFNSIILIETGEEVGSPGLAQFCAANKARLTADVLIASDGPRLDQHHPTIFGGTRGVLNFDLKLSLRAGAHHSGNWGGLLANPGIILAHALATITDARGQIKVPEWRPKTLTASVRQALAEVPVGAGNDAPKIDADWGERDADAGRARLRLEQLRDPCLHDRQSRCARECHSAHCQGTLPASFRRRDRCARDPSGLRRHLDRHGFAQIEITADELVMNATRLDPEDPWVKFASRSIAATSGRKPAYVTQSRRLAAQRCFHRHSRHAHRVGAPFLCRLLAACAQRTSAGVGRAQRSSPDDGIVLGCRRHDQAVVQARIHRDLSSRCAPEE